MKHIYSLLVLFLITAFSYAQLTPPSDQQAYYSGVDFTETGLALKSDLSTKTTDKHTNFLSYTPGVWNALKVTDLDPDNNAYVLLVYGFDDSSGNAAEHRSRNKNDNGGNNGDWNREHIYPKSLGTPNLGTSGPGSDALMLRPSDVQQNSNRGNKLFEEKSTGEFQNGESGTTSNGGWYPGDEWKGDCARIIMYMYIRYGSRCLPTNVGVGSNASTPDDMIDLFLQWNAEDPVTPFEDARNTYHTDTNNTYAQGNRNPFIDNPYLATVIWGGPDAENRWDSTQSVDVFNKEQFKIYPNPVKSNTVYIQTEEQTAYTIYSILGKKVLNGSVNANTPEVNISKLNTGVYIIKLKSASGSVTKKLIRG